jgi:alkyl hydroperoxide reductase subunit AhpC
MTEGELKPGDMAPDFGVQAALDGEVSETSLESLLEGKRGLVLTSYVLDFTGG